MTGGELIRIEMSRADADLFVKFREKQATFEILEKSGVFNVKNGAAVIDFNQEGDIMQIRFNLLGYKRTKQVINMVAIKKGLVV